MEQALDGASKDEQSVFAQEDFGQILYARDSFSRIHGKELSRRLSERIGKPHVSDTSSGAVETVSVSVNKV